jgi:hypothetical protein
MKTRFHFFPAKNEYIRKIILPDEMMMIVRIPVENWCRKTNTYVNEWIRENSKVTSGEVKVDMFLWGEIDFVEIEDDPSIREYTLNCQYCKKPYYTRSGLFKHEKICGTSIQVHSGLTGGMMSDLSGFSFDIPLDPITSHETITTQVETRDSGNIRYINSTTNQNILINNNIQIRNLGDENPNWLTSNMLYQVITDVKRAIPQLMRQKHFNDDFPENKNIRIDNKRDINSILQVFEGGRWCIRDSKHTFYRVLVDIYDVLSDALTEDADTDDELMNEQVRTARRSERFLRKVEKIRPIWDEFEEKIQSQDPSIMEELWHDLKVLLLDRQLAIEQGFE